MSEVAPAKFGPCRQVVCRRKAKLITRRNGFERVCKRETRPKKIPRQDPTLLSMACAIEELLEHGHPLLVQEPQTFSKRNGETSTSNTTPRRDLKIISNFCYL